MTQPLRIAIVGAGIGGLSAAIALQKTGAEIVVLERAPELEPLGAGICLWPNGGQALEAIGLEETLGPVSPILKHLSYLDGQGNIRREMSFDYLNEQTGCRSYPVARSDLHLALLKQIDPETIRLGVACVDVQQHDTGARVVLEDGSTVEADLLIGADGVRSVVRNAVTGGNHHLRYHYSTWCGLVPEDPAICPVDTFKFFVQDAKRVGLLNVGGGRLYYFCDAAVPDEEQDGDGVREQLQKLFAGWCPTVQALVQAIGSTAPSRLPVYDLDPLDTYVRGSIALLGDAAHATTPTLGQGGAMAMEDAIVLADCLADNADLDTALARYDAARLPRSQEVVLASRARTAAAFELDKRLARDWQKQLKNSSGNDFMDEQVRIYHSGPLANTA